MSVSATSAEHLDSASWEERAGFSASMILLTRRHCPNTSPPSGQPPILRRQPPRTQAWEARLAQLSYDTIKSSHIHVLWPQSLPNKNAVTQAGLWHVCPAHVYEARVNAAGQVQVVVNFENCIKCETCWRTSDIVDWGRDGAHQFVYAVHSPVVTKLLRDMEQTVGSGQWAVGSEERIDLEVLTEKLGEIGWLINKLDQKLADFDESQAQDPRHIDRDRSAHLEMQARYAHQLALQLSFSRVPERSAGHAAPPAQRLIDEILALTHHRIEHVTACRYSWAAADGRQLRFHHLPEFCRADARNSRAPRSR